MRLRIGDRVLLSVVLFLSQSVSVLPFGLFDEHSSYCLGNHHTSSSQDMLRPEVSFDYSRYKCPETFDTVRLVRGNFFLQKYICNRSSSFHYPMRSMKHFLHFLLRSNKTVLYVGDSLTEQMYFAFLCGVESEDSTLFSLAKRRVIFSWSSFLTNTLPTGCAIKSVDLEKHPHISSQQWFNITATNREITHVIINTGPWWSASRIGANHRSCFERQFSKGSKLYNMLFKLKYKNNVTIIWRDNAPAGACGVQSPKEFSYDDFKSYNLIAKRSLHDIALSIPYIWNESVPKWAEHVYRSDTLHWCLFLKNSVPNMWNTLLFDMLLKNELDIYLDESTSSLHLLEAYG